MALQAYIDDSGNIGDGKVFVLAGYVSTSKRWVQFTDQWKAVLDKPPALPHFKMKEANAGRGAFRGWSRHEIDQKLNDLADVVNANVMFGVSCVLDNADYLTVAKNKTTVSNLNDPYFFLFSNIIQSIALTLKKDHYFDTVDFIFDNQGKPQHKIVDAFESLVQSSPNDVKRAGILSGPPIFRDDKQVLPLQAADMIAWQLRRHYEEQPKTHPGPAPGPILKKLWEGVPFASSPWHGDLLQAVVEGTNMFADILNSAPPGKQLDLAYEIKAKMEHIYRSLKLEDDEK